MDGHYSSELRMGWMGWLVVWLVGWLVQRTTDYNIPIYNNNGEAMEN